jgi:hypothetical protein
LGWAHYVKAQIEYREADLKKQREFAIQFLKDFQGIADDIALLFQEETSAGISPHKGYGWTFNQRLIVKAKQSHKERLTSSALRILWAAGAYNWPQNLQMRRP